MSMPTSRRKVMYLPLVVLAVFALTIGWTFPGPFSVANLLEQARPAGLLHDKLAEAKLLGTLHHPNEHLSHATDIHVPATIVAFATAGFGFLLATAFYGLRLLNPAEVRQQFSASISFLLNKWYFDELYQAIFVRPAMFISGLVANFDKQVIDRFIDRLAAATYRGRRQFDDAIDRYLVDGLVNLVAGWTYSIGSSLRSVANRQTATICDVHCYWHGRTDRADQLERSGRAMIGRPVTHSDIDQEKPQRPETQIKNGRLNAASGECSPFPIPTSRFLVSCHGISIRHLVKPDRVPAGHWRLVLAFLPKEKPDLIKFVSLATTLIVFAMTAFPGHPGTRRRPPSSSSAPPRCRTRSRWIGFRRSTSTTSWASTASASRCCC